MAFSGCEDAEPRINDDGELAVTILDGTRIEVIFTAIESGQELIYRLEMPSKRAAEAVAFALPDEITGPVLLDFGFKFIN
jgi:hypothetical protein